jgi:hypothetical protein
MHKLSGVDVGCAALIANGSVKLKHGVEIASFSERGVLFNDGSEMNADAVIFA